jgi:hypothetical protein
MRLMKMLRRFFLLQMLLGSGVVFAEWTQIGESIDYTGYVDLATIQRTGSVVKMWDLMDYKTPRRGLGLSFLSQQGQSEYDCKSKKMRVMSFAWFSGNLGNGQILHNSTANLSTQKWNLVLALSTSEALWNIACGNVKIK